MDGKSVVITGAGSGIGRATAEAFAQEGASVVVTDIREDVARETADGIIDSGGDATAHQLNVQEFDRFVEVLEATKDEFGHLDVLFNNAGLLRLDPFEKTTDDDRDLVLDVNANGVWNGCQAAVPIMQEQESGSIVNTASVDALLGAPYHAAYGMAKAAVLNLTKTLAVELGSTGIRVNAVCPGSTLSPPMQQFIDSHDDPDRARREIAEGHALKRLAKPSEIANCVVFLGSEKASNVTGHGLVADGGYTIQKQSPFES